MLVICCFNIDQFSKWPTNSQNEEKYTDEGYLKVVKGTSVSTSFLNSANKILYNNDKLNSSQCCCFSIWVRFFGYLRTQEKFSACAHEVDTQRFQIYTATSKSKTVEGNVFLIHFKITAILENVVNP